MADNISTLILTVDLQCCRCYKKIKKVLCKLQDREKIQKIDYDEKNNTVTISGPFDPHCLSKKLRCKACKVIKDIKIKPPEPPPPPPPPPPEPAPPPPPPPEPAPPPPPPPEPAPPPPPPPEPAPPPPPPPPPEPAPPPPPPPEPAPPPPPAPAPPPPEPCRPKIPEPPPACCCRPCPCYQAGYSDGLRCCSCGRLYDWGWGPPPVYCEGYKIVCEEDPAYPCIIM
uniref:Protein PYRICULARIA ORYZAE RESISTANCE 21 n=1 Tax=Elaeis guineensis var. tenera TaxID=51953 RepID=A0A6I9QE25_ELAGV|nr:protein PYRICULARIA ORYZAE RESISTANCE 21 [Elaeis guineensis]